MSNNHNDHREYWKDVYPRLGAYLAAEAKKEVKDILFSSIAFFAYVTEDIGTKVTKNNHLSPKLDLFLIYAFDQLRAALPLYENLNLAPIAISARATFENAASLKFIVESKTPDKFTDLYNRFKDILRLKAHQNSTLLGVLPQAEIDKILKANPEWVDPGTGKLVKRPHWTAITGMNFEQLVTQAGMKDYYSLYRTTSNFVHASPVTVNLYKSAQGLGAIASEVQAKRMSLLIPIFALDTLKDFCMFFGVSLDQPEYLNLLKVINSLSQ